MPRSKNKSTTVDSRISSQGQHTQKLHSRETGQVGQATASIAQIVRVILSTESFTPSLRTNQIAQATANFAQIRPAFDSTERERASLTALKVHSSRKPLRLLQIEAPQLLFKQRRHRLHSVLDPVSRMQPVQLTDARSRQLYQRQQWHLFRHSTLCRRIVMQRTWQPHRH